MALGSVRKRSRSFSEPSSRAMSGECSLAAAWGLAWRFRKQLSSSTVERFVQKALDEVWAQYLLSNWARYYHFPRLKFRHHSHGVLGANHITSWWSRSRADAHGPHEASSRSGP